jgi:hypothetical protein
MERLPLLDEHSTRAYQVSNQSLDDPDEIVVFANRPATMWLPTKIDGGWNECGKAL